MFYPKQIQQLAEIDATPSYMDAQLSITAQVDTGLGYQTMPLREVTPLQASRVMRVVFTILYEDTRQWKVSAYSGVEALNIALTALIACQNTRTLHRGAKT